MQRQSPRNRLLNRDSQLPKVSTQTSSWMNFNVLDMNPALWLDASDLSTLTLSSDKVTQWADKSGNGRNFTQSTDGFRPTSGVATQNGLNVIRFDGVDDRMTTSWSGLPVNGFYAVVFRKNGGLGSQVIFSNGAERYPVFVNSTNNLSGYITTTNGPISTNTVSGFNLCAIVMDPAKPYVWMNGIQTTSASVGSASGGTMTIGFNGVSLFFFNGDIAEALFFVGKFEMMQIIPVMDYLRNKWALYG